MRQTILISLSALSLCFFMTTRGNCQLTSQPLDTTLSVFSNYKLRIKIFDLEKTNDYDTAKNTVITFFKYQNDSAILLFIDSTFCNSATIKFQDFNNDGANDILIFYDYDVRGNEMYHLYLVNSKTKNLIRVKGFEDIKNPEFNRKKNIIESHVISGRSYITYYRIDKTNRLVYSNKVIYQ